MGLISGEGGGALISGCLRYICKYYAWVPMLKVANIQLYGNSCKKGIYA